jgi:hypothetical protein
VLVVGEVKGADERMTIGTGRAIKLVAREARAEDPGARPVALSDAWRRTILG